MKLVRIHTRVRPSGHLLADKSTIGHYLTNINAFGGDY